MRIQIVKDSVVEQETDAIVNAANITMLGGGGVDGAIHDAAGRELYDFFNAKNHLWKPGDVELSPGFGLKAKYILNAVGPVWEGGGRDEAALLEKCYLGCMDKAADAGCRSVAFCCISTGIYGYPLEAATRIAIGTVQAWLKEHDSNMLVRFCCFTNRELDVYRRVAQELGIFCGGDDQ